MTSNNISQITDYQLQQKCGRGAYGDVWVAKDASERLVALKLLYKEVSIKHELNGLRACSKLSDCSGLVKILHIGETEHFFYYTMELADSMDTANYIPATLSNILFRNGKLPEEKVFDLARQILPALSHLHRFDLIHRDIKPENILMINGNFKLSDVGLICTISQSMSLGGTLGFIPPEKLLINAGCQSAADDLYAFGKVLYCAWTGNRVEDYPAIPAELIRSANGRRLNQVITTACSRNVKKRFSSAEKFLNALDTGVRFRDRYRNAILLFSAVAAVAIIAAAAGGIFLPLLLKKEAPAAENIIQNNIPPQTAAAPPAAVTPPKPPEKKLQETLLYSDLMTENNWKLYDTHDFPLDKATGSWSIIGKNKGSLELKYPLPKYYRIVFDIDVKSIAGEIIFKLFDGRNGYFWGIRSTYDKKVILQRIIQRNRIRGGFYQDIDLLPESNRFEMIYTPDGGTIKINGQAIDSEGYDFAGPRFIISIDTRETTEVKLSGLKIFERKYI